jgi:hypothetical protein
MVGYMEAQPTPDPILADIERFLSATGMTPTAFGSGALNDPAFVHQLRKGRECKRATRAKVRAFIEAARSDAAA